MWRKLLTIGILLISLPAWPQQVPDFEVTQSVVPESGWEGLLDTPFMVDVLMTLSFSALLGGALAYHPKNTEITRASEGMNSPRVFMLFPVIGAIVGMMVLKYGLVVGFVLFGLGGIVRFRTAFRSPSLTGRIILVTLIGLACGLHLMNIAVVATLFSVVLIYFLDMPMRYRIVVQDLPREHLAEAIAAYREVIDKQGCRVLYEQQNCRKSRVTFVLKCNRVSSGARLEKILETEVDDALAGVVSWRIA
jgi:hypothetical protein